MGLKDKMKSTFTDAKNKLTDAIVSAKSIFEKECKDYTCFSTKSLFDTIEVKAKIIDEAACIIQFSGDIQLLTKDLEDWFLVDDETNEISVIDKGSIAQKVEDIQQKAKVEQYITTTAKYTKKVLSLVNAATKPAAKPSKAEAKPAAKAKK